MVHIDLVGQLGFFVKVATRLVPEGWVEHKISGYRCHFRAFQFELDNLGTKNFEIGSVIKKLQPFEVDEILVKSEKFKQKFHENPSFCVQKLVSYDFLKPLLGSPKMYKHKSRAGAAHTG